MVATHWIIHLTCHAVLIIIPEHSRELLLFF